MPGQQQQLDDAPGPQEVAGVDLQRAQAAVVVDPHGVEVAVAGLRPARVAQDARGP